MIIMEYALFAFFFLFLTNMVFTLCLHHINMKCKKLLIDWRHRFITCLVDIHLNQSGIWLVYRHNINQVEWVWFTGKHIIWRKLIEKLKKLCNQLWMVPMIYALPLMATTMLLATITLSHQFMIIYLTFILKKRKLSFS